MQDEYRQSYAKAATAITLAVIMLAAVAVNYCKMPGRCFEMTFISNVGTAAVLVAGAIKIFICGRDIPDALYLDATVLLLTVLAICAIFAPGVCFAGPSLLLHLVDPLAMFAFYLLYCGRSGKVAIALSALTVPFMYYIFMIVFGRVTGGYVYIYFDPNAFSGAALAGVAALATAAITAVSIAVMYLGQKVNKKLAWGSAREV